MNTAITPPGQVTYHRRRVVICSFIVKKRLLRAGAPKARRWLLQRVFNSSRQQYIGTIWVKLSGSPALTPPALGNHYLWRTSKNSLGTSLRPPDPAYIIVSSFISCMIFYDGINYNLPFIICKGLNIMDE